MSLSFGFRFDQIVDLAEMARIDQAHLCIRARPLRSSWQSNQESVQLLIVMYPFHSPLPTPSTFLPPRSLFAAARRQQMFLS